MTYGTLCCLQNLDVNQAVNNLLSRDDEGEGEDEDSQDSYMPDDLISLLDGGMHSEHPSVIIDADTMYNEDVFGYSTLRSRTSGTRSRLGQCLHSDKGTKWRLYLLFVVTFKEFHFPVHCINYVKDCYRQTSYLSPLVLTLYNFPLFVICDIVYISNCPSPLVSDIVFLCFSFWCGVYFPFFDTVFISFFCVLHCLYLPLSFTWYMYLFPVQFLHCIYLPW